MRASGVLFVGLAATAGISSLAFAMQHDEKPSHQTITPVIHTTAPAPESASQSSDTTSISIDSETSSSSNSQATAPAEATVSGEATINNEVIPLTEGTVERSFTDSSGTEHTVKISLDGQSTIVESHSSNTSIEITSSSSSTGTNTTRGSPRR
jgi:hypothetical protein